MNEEGSEIKWEGDDLEGRQIFVWSHHSDSTRTQSPMDDILFHPIGSLPWALATADRLLRENNKASLAATLQENVKVAEQLPGNSASVIDRINSVQIVKGDQATFGDVAATVLSMALREGAESERIYYVVFDTYRDNAIKNCERILRGGEAGHQLQSITGTQLLRQWRRV